MKRVLMVSCEGLGNGGVQAVIMSIVRNLKNKYIFDILLFTDERRFYDDEFESYGGRIFRIPRYNGTNSFRSRLDYYIRGNHLYRSVLEILKENGPYDVIHCHDEFESAPILKAAAVSGVKVRIAHTHVISEKSNFIADLLNNYRKKEIEKYATIKIACSKEAGLSFFQSQDNVKIVMNPYDNKRFNPEEYAFNKKSNLQLLQVGTFSVTKNQIYSVKVVEYIKQKRPEVKLILMGNKNKEYDELLYREIIQRKLEDNVVLMPGDADMPKLLSQSSGFLFPSLHEGFGIVLIEAQAMGVKCYASDTVPRATDCGGVVYLSLNDGAKVWAERIIDDYEREKGIHLNYDVSKFSIEEVMKKYVCFYEGSLQ